MADELNMQWQQELANQGALQVAQGGWKVQREGIKAQIKIAKWQIKFQLEEMKRIGIPTMEANIWYQQQQVRLADQAHGLAQSNLGMEYLKFSSTLRGPENYFQSADFSRGASNREDVPIFMQNLLKNISSPAFQQSSGNPDPVTSASMMNKLTGGNPSTQDASALDSMSQLFSNGAHRLAPGSLESLDQSELALLASGGDKLGVDVPRWMRDYANSRVGTESPMLA